MKKEKRFSIIITAYNIEKYIEKSIESVKNQTFQNYELIVIDDCSTDRTLEKIRNFGDIQIIEHKKNPKTI